jgi:Cu-Zn family superoxide dismutase
MIYRFLPTLFLLALGLFALPACQTAENVADTTGEVAENAVATTADGARVVADVVSDAAGGAYRRTADLFDGDDSDDVLYAALVRPTGAPGASVQGSVRMMEDGDALVVELSLRDLAPGSTHGFHVHRDGSCDMADVDDDGTMEPGGAAGPHWDPMNTNTHGAPTDPLTRRHAGDFGNITADANGRVVTTLRVPDLDPGEVDFAGHAVMVHGGRDDLTSQPSGAAGARIGCGVIEGR